MSDLARKKAEAVFTSALMNMFPGGSKQPIPAPVLDSKVSQSSAMENNPEDIPKEDLLHLCMKMNKRMQSMETKGQELSKRKAVLLNERRQLLDAIKLRVAIPVYPEDDQELDAAFIVELMCKSDEHQRALIVSLEKKITDLDQLRLHDLLASDAKHRREILDLQIALSAAVSASIATTSSTSSSVLESTTGETNESVPHLSTELVVADSQVLMLNANETLMKEKDVRTKLLFDSFSVFNQIQSVIHSYLHASSSLSRSTLTHCKMLGHQIYRPL